MSLFVTGPLFVCLLHFIIEALLEFDFNVVHGHATLLRRRRRMKGIIMWGLWVGWYYYYVLKFHTHTRNGTLQISICSISIGGCGCV